MNIARRRFPQLAGGAVAAASVARRAVALDYPTRPVRLIVGFTPRRRDRHPGAPVRPMAVGAARPAFVIENRPGAGSNVGTEAVV